MFFADAGWACRACVRGASKIVTEYWIGGRVFHEVRKETAFQPEKKSLDNPIRLGYPQVESRIETSEQKERIE
jgi:hypothetical protein